VEDAGQTSAQARDTHGATPHGPALQQWSESCGNSPEVLPGAPGWSVLGNPGHPHQPPGRQVRSGACHPNLDHHTTVPTTQAESREPEVAWPAHTSRSLRFTAPVHSRLQHSFAHRLSGDFPAPWRVPLFPLGTPTLGTQDKRGGVPSGTRNIL